MLKNKQQFKVCKSFDMFYGFNLKIGCFFGRDTKGCFVSFGKRINGKMIVYRINPKRTNSMIWEPRHERIQEGTTAFKILTYLHEHPRHNINYGQENAKKLFQSQVPQY